MRTVAKITAEKHSYVVIKTDNEYNPYSLYGVVWSEGRNGYIGKHKRLISKYADMRSCLLRITEEER